MTTEIKYHTKEAAIAAVNEKGYELKFCSSKLKKNEEVVMEALKKDSWVFEYASKALKSNKVFIMKALNEGVEPLGLIVYTAIEIQSDIEIISLALEKNKDGWVFLHAQGEVAFNKELAAKALVKWGNYSEKDLHQIEQEKQAEMVAGGSALEDEVVW